MSQTKPTHRFVGEATKVEDSVNAQELLKQPWRSVVTFATNSITHEWQDYMSTTVAVKLSDIRAIVDVAFPDYRGSKTSVRIQESVSYATGDLTWQGGSKTEVVLLHWTGESFLVGSLATGPFDFGRQRLTYSGKIPNDVIVVEHVIFCGKDLGIRCVVSPDCVYLPKLKLPQVVALTRDEIVVLTIHAQLKPGYRKAAAEYQLSSLALYYNASCELVKRKLLSCNKLGATQITNEGKNALTALSADKQIRL